MKQFITYTTFLMLLLARVGFGQPVADTDFTFELVKSAYQHNEGPVITVDEGHNNLHKKDGGLSVLVRALEEDGYQVKANESAISDEVLDATDIYVIANALHASDVGNWVVPNPSAFTENEMDVLVNWVKEGGRLLLVADHMPYGGAAQDLGAKLGVEWNNGFVIKPGQHWPPSTFSLESGTLKENEITKRADDFETITTLASFTGSAFKAPKGATIIFEFDDSHEVLMPDTAWRFNEKTKKYNSKGWQQGAYFSFGKGKVVVLGEAAMITAQIVNDQFKVGFNSPQAPQNLQFALNIFHYLSDHEKYVDKDEIIENLNAAMEEAFNSGDMLKVASFYSDNAKLYGPNGNDVEGRAAIDNYWKSLEGRHVSWELETHELNWVGEECNQIGVSKLSFEQNNQTVTATTRFYLVWQPQDNSFKISKDFYHVYQR
ncbi:MAG: DUF4350 domain-containing protein [Fulvivirga sp.]|uniref:DUF4350 domain-containing protein n=1 Tax=Fulvivirga sp. TaxID=1931237 RepID=UPI0032EDB98B